MTPYVEIMKRELVVISVVGGLFWAATGLSVLAVTVFDNGFLDSTRNRALAIDDSNPGRTLADARSRDEETSASLCEAAPSDPTPPDTLQDPDRRSADAQFVDDETEWCWHHHAISLLHFCLLLT